MKKNLKAGVISVDTIVFESMKDRCLQEDYDLDKKGLFHENKQGDQKKQRYFFKEVP